VKTKAETSTNYVQSSACFVTHSDTECMHVSRLFMRMQIIAPSSRRTLVKEIHTATVHIRE